jgi:hypothetical protein
LVRTTQKKSSVQAVKPTAADTEPIDAAPNMWKARQGLLAAVAGMLSDVLPVLERIGLLGLHLTIQDEAQPPLPEDRLEHSYSIQNHRIQDPKAEATLRCENGVSWVAVVDDLARYAGLVEQPGKLVTGDG